MGEGGRASSSPPSALSRRPTIVFVAPQPPYPLTSGMTRRLFQLLEAYAAYGRVKLVFFYEGQAQLDAANGLVGLCESLHPVSVGTTHARTALARLNRWHRHVRLAWARRPAAMTREFSPELASVVSELAASADLVHVTAIHMVVQIEELLSRRGRQGQFVLDLPDVETARHAKVLRFTPLRLWREIVLGSYDWLKLWAYQRRVLPWFDRVLVCSERERQRLGGGNIVVVPNAIAVPPDVPRSEADDRTLLFLGNLSYPPNVDGAEFFVRSILPKIRAEIPDVKLRIVGRTPTLRVRALHDGRTVHVEGDVGSVSDYYRKATLAVVPLRFGGGTRIKILEAWAFGIPIVSTSLGCEGLDATDGEHLMVADTPSRFARACVELLGDAAARRRLAERGRDLVVQKYRWETVRSQVVALTGSLVEVGSPGTERRHAGMVMAT